MKRIISVIAAMTLILNITACKAAVGFVLTMQIDNPIMTINGAEREIDEGRGTAPVTVGGRTLVPIRAVIEEMGGALHWEDDTKNVIIALNENIIVLTEGDTTAFVNSEARILDIAPMTINGRTMLPIRFISENLGYSVDWDDETRLVTITKN